VTCESRSNFHIKSIGRDWRELFIRLSRHLLTAIPLLGAVLFGQSSGQEKSHADHMEHRFDNPKELAKRFDDPARDAWQMPDRVIEALGLRRGQIVADIGAGTDTLRSGLRNQPLRQRSMQSISNRPW